MKKIILVGLFSLLTACATTSSQQPIESLQDQACLAPYEEVSGFKLGCHIDTNGLKKIDSKTPGVSEFRYNIKGGFFDYVDLGVINGDLESLSFAKVYHGKGEMDKDMDAVISSLSKRWGKYTSIDIDRLTLLKTASFLNPKSKVVGDVFAGQMYMKLDSIGIIYVTYKTNKMRSHIKSAEEDDKTRRAGLLQGM